MVQTVPTNKGTLEDALEDQGLERTGDEKNTVRWAFMNPRHPRNWSLRRKAYDITIIILLGFYTLVPINCSEHIGSMATFLQNMLFIVTHVSYHRQRPPKMHRKQEQFNMDPILSLLLYVSTYLLAQGIGCVVCPPYSECFGCKRLYVVSTVFYSIFCIIIGAVSHPAAAVNQLGEADKMGGVLCFWESGSEDELTAKASEQLQTAARIGFSPLLVWVMRGVAIGAGKIGEASLWEMVRSARIKYPQLRLRIVDLEDDVDMATATTLSSLLMMSNEPECVVRGGRVLVPRMQSQVLHGSMPITSKCRQPTQQNELGLKGPKTDEVATANPNWTGVVLDTLENKMSTIGPKERILIVQRLVRDVTAEALGMTSAEEVDMHRGLVDIGVDSLGSIQMRKQVAARTGVLLPTNLMTGYADLMSLCEALEQQLGDSWTYKSASKPVAA